MGNTLIEAEKSHCRVNDGLNPHEIQADLLFNTGNCSGNQKT
jgi:hypothetical protein